MERNEMRIDETCCPFGNCSGGIANLFGGERREPDPFASGGQFEGIDSPEIEGIGSGVSPRGSGETIAAGSEERVDLVMGGEEPLGLPG